MKNLILFITQFFLLPAREVLKKFGNKICLFLHTKVEGNDRLILVAKSKVYISKIWYCGTFKGKRSLAIELSNGDLDILTFKNGSKNMKLKKLLAGLDIKFNETQGFSRLLGTELLIKRKFKKKKGEYALKISYIKNVGKIDLSFWESYADKEFEQDMKEIESIEDQYIRGKIKDRVLDQKLDNNGLSIDVRDGNISRHDLLRFPEKIMDLILDSEEYDGSKNLEAWEINRCYHAKKLPPCLISVSTDDAI